MNTMRTTIRLNKYLAQCGVASRRGADALVFAERVTINGSVADSPGIQVDSLKDTVCVDGKKVCLEQNEATSRTLLMHKPTQVVTTVSDPQGRPTVMDYLPGDCASLRFFPVGRLDFFSEGLLLLTTDGELCHRLTHPKWHLPKVYSVTVRGSVSEKAVHSMKQGMTLAEGERLAPVFVELGSPVAETQVMTMTLHQGINRQIRRMCRDLGLTILTLKRVQQGPIRLGALKAGQVRELVKSEIKELKEAVGIKA